MRPCPQYNQRQALCIDGEPKHFAESANLWTIMRGNAAEHATPTVRGGRGAQSAARCTRRGPPAALPRARR